MYSPEVSKLSEGPFGLLKVKDWNFLEFVNEYGGNYTYLIQTREYPTKISWFVHNWAKQDFEVS